MTTRRNAQANKSYNDVCEHNKVRIECIKCLPACMERLDEGNDDGNVGLDDVVMTGGQEEQAVSPAPQNNTGNASSAGVVCTAVLVVKLSQEGATGCRRCRQGRCTCSSSRTGGESMRKGQTNNRVVDCAQEHAGWDKRFQELRAFKDQYGHTIVPRSNMTLYR